MSYSYDLAMRAFNQGPQALKFLEADMRSADPTTRAVGERVFLDAAICVADLVGESIRQGAVCVTPRPPTGNELRYQLGAHPDRFWKSLSIVFETLVAIRRAVPGIRADDATPAPVQTNAPPPTPQPINIAVAIKMPDETRTTIVAMPERVTSSTVKREEGTGNIISTTQIERDADA